MTKYAGEEQRIWTSATTPEGEALTDEHVVGVTVSVYDGLGSLIVDEGEMTYDSEVGQWEYLWDTTGLDPGGYRFKVSYEGLNGKKTWEWKRARLTANPL